MLYSKHIRLSIIYRRHFAAASYLLKAAIVVGIRSQIAYRQPLPPPSPPPPPLKANCVLITYDESLLFFCLLLLFSMKYSLSYLLHNHLFLFYMGTLRSRLKKQTREEKVVRILSYLQMKIKKALEECKAKEEQIIKQNNA